MSPKIVYFDIGNVFMTFDKIFTRVTHDYNLDLSQFDAAYEPYDVAANLGRITIPQVWTELCQKLNIAGGESYDFVKSWVSDYESILPMHQLATAISQKYPVGIISNYYLGFFEEATTQGFIPSLTFSPKIISAEVGCQKPDLKIYQIAETKSGFSGQEVFFIDDKMENIVAAQKLGWQTFCFDYKNVQVSVDHLSKMLLNGQ